MERSTLAPASDEHRIAGEKTLVGRDNLRDGTSGVSGGYAADGTLTRLLVDFDLFG